MKKHKQHDQVTSTKRTSSFINWHFIISILATAIFIFICLQLDLTQDDAYISFRYAANYLSGHGLVFNYGEHVEGFTNFLWVMLLALFKGVFGVDFLTFSRITGMISGAGLFFLIYILLRHRFEKVPYVIHISLAIMLLCNLSIAYWSIASLETSAFAFMVFASIVAEFRRPQLTPAFLIISTLLRPEGVIVFGIILINRIITERKMPWMYMLIYIVPLVPFAVFKLVYYGSLFPNSYYAKSGVDLEYIQSGLEYLWHFTLTVGIYGIIFLIPILAIKRLWNKYSLLYLYVFLYTIYIVWVGGDVLHVYRFFVPVVPVLYFLFVMSMIELSSSVKYNRSHTYIAILVGVIAFSIGSILLSYNYIITTRNAEKVLMSKMYLVSSTLKKHTKSNFSLATSTIGLIGYQLLGHRVIDMLGLTDSCIARNPERVEGMPSSWRERRFNNRYLLEQQPDFIMFSTDIKPSAPAERALLLHSEFRHNYTAIGFMSDRKLYMIWQRKCRLNMAKDVVNPDLEFVNKFVDGFYHVNHTNLYDVALGEIREARQRLGEDFAMLPFMIGDCFRRMNRADSAMVYFRQAVTLDTLCWIARLYMLEIASRTGDTTAFLNQKAALQRQTPWIFERNNKSF
jgi:hypothetical protein